MLYVLLIVLCKVSTVAAEKSDVLRNCMSIDTKFWLRDFYASLSNMVLDLSLLCFIFKANR